MKAISGESYRVVLEEDARVAFQGALRLSGTEEYAPILELLKSTADGTAAGVTIDLR